MSHSGAFVARETLEVVGIVVILPRSRVSRGADAYDDLAGWIVDPQTHKPGNRMPQIVLPPDDFHALLDYLTTLR